MRSLVIGGAGFIGSHLVDRLVERGPVTVFDDLSVGKLAFIEQPLASGRATFVEGDVRVLEQIVAAAPGHDIVFHLAANPEARRGLENTRLDLELGTIATYNALEAARLASIPRFVLASSGTVYGETDRACAELDLGELPISLYGASKLAGEALVSAFVECFSLRGNIFRFGNVVGPRGTHGAALDFLKKLEASHDRLEVLGDGRQAKPYLHVTDCVDAILFSLDQQTPRLTVLNIAPHDTTSVREIAEMCVEASPYPTARIEYTGGDRGWKGDVPRSRMNASKLETLGYRLRYSSNEAVRTSVGQLAREVFGERARPLTSLSV
ncbi:MAG: NAD-dependent epimerase/dehydratase family protein [Polyangiaceae bacterium]